MAHLSPSGGLPSGHPDGDVNASKRPVSASSEKENQQSSSRVIKPNALQFFAAPPGGPVILQPSETVDVSPLVTLQDPSQR